MVEGANSGRATRTKALLDTGSNRSFCTEGLATRLKEEGRKGTLSINTVMGQSVQNVKEIVMYIWGVKRKRGDTVTKQVMPRVTVINHLPGNLNLVEATSKDIRRWTHLGRIEVAESCNDDVELIIGLDMAHLTVPLECRKGENNTPYAIKTKLGWAVCGPVGRLSIPSQEMAFLTEESGSIELDLEKQLRHLWEIEGRNEFEEGEERVSEEDKRVIRLWETTGRQVDKHYELKIPFREDNPRLPNNERMARWRLESLQKRLARDPQLARAYSNEMKKLLELGYAEKVPKEEIHTNSGKVWYIPHHPVLNPNKPEKVRIVFDCAAKYANTSLNSRVMQGPDLANKLIGVLIRFRKEQVAIMADIEAMYHQIRVHPCDRDVLRFLWNEDEADLSQPTVYRMKVHLFGGVWSPSCATYALQRTFKDYQNDFPDTMKEAGEQFYVDDLLLSLPSVQEAYKATEDLRNLLRQGGFRLTKWVSNRKQVLSGIPETEKNQIVREINLGLSKLPTERALGLTWDLEKDTFSIKVCTRNKPPTKRGLLSTVSSVYDPLGFACPFVIKARILFQEECRRKKGWDEPMAECNYALWKKWTDELPSLVQIKLPRCYHPHGIAANPQIQLHVFCDASSSAYAAVAYLRITSNDEEAKCAFMCGRARLAPLKSLTIPRLELCAAVLASKVDVMIRNEIQGDLPPTIFWTDSMLVLGYITNQQQRFKTFVTNRIAVIKRSTDSHQWRYVNTRLNPADEATRGLPMDRMLRNSRWISGPDFLIKNEEHWPVTPIIRPVHGDEVKSKVPINLNACCEETVLQRMLRRCSSWRKLLHGVAWLRKYLVWLRSSNKRDTRSGLTTAELDQAKWKVLEMAQRESYGHEKRLLAGNGVSTGSSLYRLEPYKDKGGLLRVGGRIKNQVEYMDGQILVSKSHPLAKLIVRHVHEMQAGHGGREFVLSILRQDLWIPQCRRLIDKVLRECVVCRRNNWKQVRQREADLPQDRTTPGSPPFHSTGVDCFGPFLVRQGRKQFKRYGCIFTCMATRAIHLEVLGTLEAESFLNAVTRFAARRGRPKQIRSDNGTNIKRAEKEIRLAVRSWEKKKMLTDKLVDQGIQWIFNPPYASHTGGVWERQIRTVRKVLRAVVGSQVLDDERLQTVFCEVEDIVNSRPITIVSTCPSDLEALTPGHLLRGHGTRHLPIGGSDLTDDYRRRWKHAQFIADQFWKRWLKEYLPSLQRRRGRIADGCKFQVDDVVILTQDLTPRNEWKLGRVTEIMPGGDGVVRKVKVKTKTGSVIRSVTKLCLLEGVTATVY